MPEAILILIFLLLFECIEKKETINPQTKKISSYINNQKDTLHIYDGVYKLAGGNKCNLRIRLKNNTFNLETNKRKESGVIEISRESEKVFFLFRVEESSGNLEIKPEFRGEYEDSSILIQNYGNAENPFSQFEECEDKYLVLKKAS
ncbi:hypothetical protein [Sinomicrobium soli]|uniref:hypothetical protein n=1 Tax=Sinomicrobium sp. N-1-3-6 TaxID=2219864 RepID=UPI000DCD3A25|nr:hypothetical protein [Sinomicrobium sp. N-1-3-6]RAV30769.1 hypothetical protein DN748_00475 [Sinomicrobium sp. N-1-3-6]